LRSPIKKVDKSGVKSGSHRSWLLDEHGIRKLCSDSEMRRLLGVPAQMLTAREAKRYIAILHCVPKTSGLQHSGQIVCPECKKQPHDIASKNINLGSNPVYY
jgi:hypothetical protein